MARGGKRRGRDGEGPPEGEASARCRHVRRALSGTPTAAPRCHPRPWPAARPPGTAVRQSAKARLPIGDLCGKARLARNAELSSAALLGSSTPSTYSAAVRSWRSPAPMVSSSLIVQDTPEFQQPAPDPALHGAERHAVPLGKLLIGEPVKERRADRRRLTLLELLQAVLEPRLILADFEPLEARSNPHRELRRQPRAARAPETQR
mgnify:CR=1 FL=1